MGRVIGALLLTVLLLTGCAREEPLSGSRPEPSAQSSSQSAPAAEEPSSQPESQSEASSDTETAEVDLTGMSSTMVFAEVYNMMMEPESYEGKTVRMQGELVSYPHPSPGRTAMRSSSRTPWPAVPRGSSSSRRRGLLCPRTAPR